MSSVRFKTPLAQKVYLHQYIDKLPFRDLHVIDTKHGHSKRLITRHKVHQMGYDFQLPSTEYLEHTRVRPNDVVWLDYCCTPTRHFVIKDMQLCTSKWVFATYSRRCKWKSQIKYVARDTPYRVAWKYTYCDTAPMVIVAYHKETPPPTLVNPVGRRYKYKWRGMWYKRTCNKLLLPPDDDEGIYLDLGDSNEPMRSCTPTF